MTTNNCLISITDFTSQSVVLASMPLEDFKKLLARGLGTWVEPPDALLELSDKLDNLPLKTPP